MQIWKHVYRTVAGALSQCFLQLWQASCRVVSQGWRARTCQLLRVLGHVGQGRRVILTSYWILNWWMLWCKGKDFKFEKYNKFLWKWRITFSALPRGTSALWYHLSLNLFALNLLEVFILGREKHTDVQRGWYSGALNCNPSFTSRQRSSSWQVSVPLLPLLPACSCHGCCSEAQAAQSASAPC